MQPFIESNSIYYDEIGTKNQEVEKLCFVMSGRSGSPNNTQSNRERAQHIILSS